MRHDLGKWKGNMELGKTKEKEKKDHCQQVYDAILSLQNKAKTNDIKQWIDSLTKLKNESLESEASRRCNNQYYLYTKKEKDDFINQNWNYSVSKRTIERCIQNDSRILKNGWYYSVDENARFETRYLDPIGFGQKIYDDTIGKQPFNPNYINEATMSEMIQGFGILVMSIFIEASRPFEDKSKSLRDRDELVEYWAKKAIPVDRMFNAFWMVFNMSLAKLRNLKPIDGEKRSRNEMEQSQIDECLRMLKRSYPKITSDLPGYKGKDRKMG